MHVQSDTLLLADVFENVWNIWTWSCLISFCTKTVASSPTLKKTSKIGWTWSCLISFCIKTLASSRALKKTKVKLDLLTDIDILVMLEKFIRGGICYAIHQYAKASNKYMKDCYLKVIWSGLEVHRNLVKVS